MISFHLDSLFPQKGAARALEQQHRSPEHSQRQFGAVQQRQRRQLQDLRDLRSAVDDLKVALKTGGSSDYSSIRCSADLQVCLFRPA
jgi:hypothetical protein